MNLEPDIFDYLQTTSLEPHDDYTSEISYKDQKIIWNRLQEQDKEIERLNNIINEIEDRIVIKLQRDYHEHDYRINTGDLEEILDKLKELKENNNE